MPYTVARRHTKHVAYSRSLGAPAEIEVEVPVEHGLLVENLLDLVRG